MTLRLLAAVLAALAFTPPSGRPMTLDDEMKLRAIVDVRVAPDGSRVAYVVSTPSVARNEHEPAVFVVATGGGAPSRVGETVPILNTPLPAPRLRWSPDSTTITLLAL